MGAPTAGTAPTAATPPVVPQVPARTGKHGGRLASRALVALVAMVAIAAAAGYWWLNRPPDRYKPDNSGLYPIKVDGKYGFMDRTGKTVITPQFDQTGGFSEGLAPVVVGTKLGYVNTKGAVVITPQFDGVSPGGAPLQPFQFRFGRARVLLGNRSGFIDKDGKYILTPSLHWAGWFSGDLAPVLLTAGEAAFVDRAGKIVMSGKFQGVGPVGFTAGLALASSGGKWGYIDPAGKWAIEPQFEAGGAFADGLARVITGERTGYIDRKGKFVINPQFDIGYDFYDGYAVVGSVGAYTFVDTNGRMLGDAKFAAAGHFADGLAPVKTDDGWGYIDTTGKMIVSPQFDYAEAFQNGLARVTVAGKEAYVTTAGAFVIDPLPGRAGIPTHPVQEIWEGTVGGPGESKSRVRFILIREGAQIHGYYRPLVDRPGLLVSVKGQAAQDGPFSMADQTGTTWKARFVSAALITGVRVNPAEASAKEAPLRLRLLRDATTEELNDAQQTLEAFERQTEAERAQTEISSQQANELKRVFMQQSAFGVGFWQGDSSNARDSWPMRVRVVSFDGGTGKFTGTVEWASLGAVHRLDGTVVGTKVVFKEVGYVRRGNALLGCVYELELTVDRRLVGSFGRCDGTSETGRTQLALQAPSAPPPGTAPIKLEILVQEESWLMVKVDTAVVLERVVRAGERLAYQASTSIAISSGNAGSLSLTINGKPARPLGTIGQVVTATIKLDTLASFLR